jgi:cell division protease FtsH
MGDQNPLAKRPDDERAKRNRETYKARSSAYIYAGVAWVIGLLLTLIAAGVLAYVLANVDVSRAGRDQITAYGLAIIWWLNPLSLGALGYIFGNLRAWRFWAIPVLLLWAFVNVLISFSFASDSARSVVADGLVTFLVIVAGLYVLYLELRYFLWVSNGKPTRFIFGMVGWAALHGAIYWAVLDPDFRQFLFAALGALLQIMFAIFYVIIQFVAIFWFISQTRVEVILPGDPKQITFDDYRGQPNLLKLVRQWISLLSDREKFQSMGGQFINGLLLYGEPGTGKTLLAKAMAGEAGIAFISIEGSGFRGMFWGMDTLRMIQFVRKARNLAREYGSCIAYIDEIDAVAMSRGSVMGGGGMGMMGGMGMGGGSGALTRLLYEMDGIGEQTRWERLRVRWYQWRKKPVPPRDWHILFMGSTNRPDVLDPALTRPGRFDRTVVVNRPDRGGRREIVKYYLSKVRHDDTVDIEALVSDTAWATPARIMSAITKDAVRLALFDGRDRVSQSDIELAFQEQALGLENPIEEMEEDQRRQVAYHEAGHAIVQYYLRPDERIVRVSIVRRASALGYVLPVSNYDKYAEPLRNFVADILVSMAGHVSTKLFLGEYWTGATGDFRNVRGRILDLAHFGYFGPPLDMQQGVGDSLMNRHNKIIEKFWKKLEDKTAEILAAHSTEVHAVAKALLERGDMPGRDCIEIIRASANGNGEVDSEGMLKALVEETIFTVSENSEEDASSNTEAESQPKTKAKTKSKSG